MRPSLSPKSAVSPRAAPRARHTPTAAGRGRARGARGAAARRAAGAPPSPRVGLEARRVGASDAAAEEPQVHDPVLALHAGEPVLALEGEARLDPLPPLLP